MEDAQDPDLAPAFRRDPLQLGQGGCQPSHLVGPAQAGDQGGLAADQGGGSMGECEQRPEGHPVYDSTEQRQEHQAQEPGRQGQPGREVRNSVLGAGRRIHRPLEPGAGPGLGLLEPEEQVAAGALRGQRA